jgi:hypothetical protein
MAGPTLYSVLLAVAICLTPALIFFLTALACELCAKDHQRWWDRNH